MMTPRAAAALIANIRRDLARLEAGLGVMADAGGDADVAVPPAAEPASSAPGDLIELPAAARRFGIAQDTLRSWMRQDPSLGRKIGGRWYASIRSIRERVR